MAAPPPVAGLGENTGEVWRFQYVFVEAGTANIENAAQSAAKAKTLQPTPRRA